MLKDWEPIEFTPKEWKGSAILDGEAVEILQTTLDDHIIKTQTMRGSPYIEPFKEKIFDWEDTLMLTQENLTVWLEV
jgi:dynein heavy chain